MISAIFLPACGDKNEDKGKPNVLFIAVDDLRPELGYICLI